MSGTAVKKEKSLKDSEGHGTLPFDSELTEMF
eukprot:COSAG02_NODE_40028_length_410_cov_0.556270_1_plen_31_part_01